MDDGDALAGLNGEVKGIQVIDGTIYIWWHFL